MSRAGLRWAGRADKGHFCLIPSSRCFFFPTRRLTSTTRRAACSPLPAARRPNPLPAHPSSTAGASGIPCGLLPGQGGRVGGSPRTNLHFPAAPPASPSSRTAGSGSQFGNGSGDGESSSVSTA